MSLFSEIMVKIVIGEFGNYSEVAGFGHSGNSFKKDDRIDGPTSSGEYSHAQEQDAEQQQEHRSAKRGDGNPTQMYGRSEKCRERSKHRG
jgi:hypothetical protein